MTKFAILACALGLWLLSLFSAHGAAQVGGVAGGAMGGGNVVRPPSPNAADALLLSPAEFSGLSDIRRQEVLRAWADGRVSNAGPQVLALIQAGLDDSVAAVRKLAIRCLLQVTNEANMRRLNRRPIATDPSARPELQSSLIKMMSDQDSGLRGDAATLLLLLPDPTGQLERVTLSRFFIELDPSVRSKLLRLVSARADVGSEVSKRILLDALGPAEHRYVRASAISQISRIRLTEALPQLFVLLDSGTNQERQLVATSLGAFGAHLTGYCSKLKDSVVQQADSATLESLKELLKRHCAQ